MSQPRIVLLGHVCIDHNKSEHATYTGWGSSVMYMAQYYQKYNSITPTIMTSYGPDLLPYLPAAVLLPTTPNQTQTLVYENDSTSGRRIQHCHNVSSAPPPSITEDMITVLSEADIIIVATLLPNYTARYLNEVLALAKPNCLKVLCPQGYFRHISGEGRVTAGTFDEAQAIVRAFDLVLYSEEDHPYAMELAKEWSRAGVDIIVTQSANGAAIVHDGAIRHIPTQPIQPEEIVDSVGCGDIFAATAAHAYYQTSDLQTAVLAGHKAAAQKLLAVTSIK